MSTNHTFTDQERADFSPEELRRLAHKYPNRKHPFCGWCHVPHRPVEREADCEAAERELDAEDYAVIDRRLQEVLRLLDYDSIRAEVQGELWHFLTDPESADTYHSRATRELMDRREKIRQDATIARGMVALIVAELRKAG